MSIIVAFMRLRRDRQELPTGSWTEADTCEAVHGIKKIRGGM